MSKRSATPEEQAKCAVLYEQITDLLDGVEFDIIMNTMCFTFGELGYDLHKSLTKQAFIAQLVEQVSSAYDTCRLGKSNPEGEA